MNNNLRLEDFLRAYADIHGHTFPNTQALEVRMRIKRHQPFAVVIGKTCGVRIDDIRKTRYYKSMTSLRHSLDQHWTVLLFCVPGHWSFVRMTPENYSEMFGLMDPVHRVNLDKNPGKPGPSIWDWERALVPSEAEDFQVYRDCHHYLKEKCMRTPEWRRPKNRCRGYGAQRTFAANELMSRY